MKKELSSVLIVGGLAVLTIAVLTVAFLGADGGPRSLDAEAEVINVTTARYGFTPGSMEPITVTEGSVVVLRITSTDVTHGFAIQGYGINEEVPPGQTVEVKFRATKTGSFTIYCTVFCGTGHPEHKGTLNVVPA